MAFCFPPVVNQRLAFEKPLAKLSRALSRRRSAQRRRRRGSDEVGNAARKVVPSLAFFFQSSVIVEQSAERFQTGKEEREEEEARVRKTGPPRPLSSPFLTTLAPRRRRCLPRPAETRTCEGAVAEKERERRKAAERANRTEGEEKRFQMHSSSSSRFSLSLPLLPIRRGKPYLRPYVLGSLLGGSAVVGVHGLELALGPGALPLFAVLVLRRHRPALFVLLFDRQRRSAPALLLRGSVRGGACLLSEHWRTRVGLGPSGCALRERRKVNVKEEKKKVKERNPGRRRREEKKRTTLGTSTATTTTPTDQSDSVRAPVEPPWRHPRPSPAWRLPATFECPRSRSLSRCGGSRGEEQQGHERGIQRCRRFQLMRFDLLLCDPLFSFSKNTQKKQGRSPRLLRPARRAHRGAAAVRLHAHCRGGK